MLGNKFRFKDASRESEAHGGNDAPGMEPCSWNAPDATLIEEMLHRFRPRLVHLLSAACPTTAHVVMNNKIPVVAFCAGLGLELLLFFLNPKPLKHFNSNFHSPSLKLNDND